MPSVVLKIENYVCLLFVNSQRERVKLDEEELERRRKEMMENAKWREQQRTKNVTKYREEEKKEEETLKNSRDPDFIRSDLVEVIWRKLR